MTKPTLSGNHPKLCGLGAVLLASFASAPLRAEVRDFKSATGTVLRAELKKAKGTMIILRKEDGKEVQVALTNFAADDQNFILKWMAEDPTALDYNFAVRVEEKDVADSKKKANKTYERVSSVQKTYTVNIQNSAHNKVDDLSVDWCVFMLDKVQPSKYSTFSSSDTTLGELYVKHGSETVPDLMPSRNFSFTTKAFNIDSIIDKYYTGSKVKDKLQGVWLKFYRKDVLVYEWKSPIVPKTPWGGGEHKTLVKKDSSKDIAKNDPPSNKSSGTMKPATGSEGASVMGKDDDGGGDIVKIFELEDGEKK